MASYPVIALTLLLIAAASVPTDAHRALQQITELKLAALLSGAVSVPAPTDTNATGLALFNVFVRRGQFVQLDYSITASGLTGSLPPVVQHIHNGTAGTNGKPIITLPGTRKAVTPLVNVLNLKGSITNTTVLQVLSFVKEPTSLYVNVHTTLFPYGAIRGQLFNFNFISL